MENIANLFIHYQDFCNIALNLINADDEKFKRFFEKLYNMDKRALFLYIKSKKNEITKDQFEYAENYYTKRGRNLNWNE